MNTIALIIALAAARHAEEERMFMAITNSHVWITNSYTPLLTIPTDTTVHWPTDFLTLTNREYISLEGVPLIKFTDEEWIILRSNYSTRLKTNTMSFGK